MWARRLTAMFASTALLAGIGLAAAPAATAYPATAVATQVASAASAARDYPAATAYATELIEAAMAETGATSVSAALVANSRTVWSSTFGTVDDRGTPPSPRALYGIGSVSKMLTTIAVMQQVDRGLVKLDRPVFRYLPEFTMADPEYRQITVRMLLNHTAGLPGSDYTGGFTLAPNPDYYRGVLDYLATARLKTTPGSMAVYCNDCFTLAGMVVEATSGQTLEDYLRANLLQPLGMADTTFMSAPIAADRIAPVINDGVAEPLEYANLVATGGIMSTSRDMARLAAMLLGEGTYRGTRILSPDAVAQMGTPQTRTTLTVVDMPWLDYGLGWDSVTQPGLAAVDEVGWVKGGDLMQYHAAFMLAPGTDLAFVAESASRLLSSGTLEQIAESTLLRAMVEDGTLATMPTKLTSTGPPRAPVTAADLAAIEGIYPSGMGSHRVRERTANSLRIGTLLNGRWDYTGTLGTARFTLRTDGRWWSATVPGVAVQAVRAWSRTYLVLQKIGGYGHYYDELVMGQRSTRQAPLSAAWQARLGVPWLPVNEVADSVFWQNPFTVTARTVPGLRGFVYFDPSPSTFDPVSDDLGAMYLAIPTMFGRDLSDAVFWRDGGQEWLSWAGTVYRNRPGVADLDPGSTSVQIGERGYAEWRRVPQAARVSIAGATAWRVFDADLTTISAGTDDPGVVDVPAGAMVLLWGDAGTAVRVTVGVG